MANRQAPGLGVRDAAQHCLFEGIVCSALVGAPCPSASQNLSVGVRVEVPLLGRIPGSAAWRPLAPTYARFGPHATRKILRSNPGWWAVLVGLSMFRPRGDEALGGREEVMQLRPHSYAAICRVNERIFEGQGDAARRLRVPTGLGINCDATGCHLGPSIFLHRNHLQIRAPQIGGGASVNP